MTNPRGDILRRDAAVFVIVAGAVVAAFVLSSCALDTEFQPPAPPPAQRFTKEKAASPANGQRFQEGAEGRERWWKEFRPPRLNGLVEDVLQRNPTIEAAESTMRVAQYRAPEGVAKKYMESGCPELKFGGVWQLAFVDARRADFIAANSRVQIVARRPTNTVALFVAVGGG